MRAEPATTRRERRPAWRTVVLAGALLLAAAGIFVIGVGLGRALAEAPEPGRLETRIRTLVPGTLEPVTRTVTVTTQD